MQQLALQRQPGGTRQNVQEGQRMATLLEGCHALQGLLDAAPEAGARAGLMTDV